jgi:hypothetical protein
MSMWKKRPTCGPTHFCQNECIILIVEKSSPIIWTLLKVNYRPLGENSPNLVTLDESKLIGKRSEFKRLRSLENG